MSTLDRMNTTANGTACTVTLCDITYRDALFYLLCFYEMKYTFLLFRKTMQLINTHVFYTLLLWGKADMHSYIEVKAGIVFLSLVS